MRNLAIPLVLPLIPGMLFTTVNSTIYSSSSIRNNQKEIQYRDTITQRVLTPLR